MPRRVTVQQCRLRWPILLTCVALVTICAAEADAGGGRAKLRQLGLLDEQLEPSALLLVSLSLLGVEDAMHTMRTVPPLLLPA